MASLEERFVAAMVLGAVGDAMGYKNGVWEVCTSGVTIHSEVKKLGGVSALNLTRKEFMVSDDTVLHIATAEALISDWKDKETLFCTIAQKYKDGQKDMAGRAPGAVTKQGASMLRPKVRGGYRIPYNPRGGGCGAAMRSAPIGLRFYRPEQLDDLVAVAVESGRMTHNCPTGYLGSVATALFVSYAIQRKPINSWGKGLMEFYKSVSHSAGASWEELCLRGVLHGGDNDSTGIIAGSCWGALYGFEGVPEVNYKKMEYKDRLFALGQDLCKITVSAATSKCQLLWVAVSGVKGPSIMEEDVEDTDIIKEDKEVNLLQDQSLGKGQEDFMVNIEHIGIHWRIRQVAMANLKKVVVMVTR
ncbi:hypothetical protein EMCRGX_G003878 [Ephydatia muelleri]